MVASGLVLKLVHILVLALVSVLSTASGASALGPKTALRADFESGPDRVGALELEACGTRQQNRAFATAVASGSPHPARGIASNVREVLAGGDRLRAFSRTLKTSKGDFLVSVDDAADVVIQGKTLVLNEIGVFPVGRNVLAAGPKELLSGARPLLTEMRSLGFEKLIIRGERISGTHHQVDLAIDLLKY